MAVPKAPMRTYCVALHITMVLETHLQQAQEDQGWLWCTSSNLPPLHLPVICCHFFPSRVGTVVLRWSNRDRTGPAMRDAAVVMLLSPSWSEELGGSLHGICTGSQACGYWFPAKEMPNLLSWRLSLNAVASLGAEG